MKLENYKITKYLVTKYLLTKYLVTSQVLINVADVSDKTIHDVNNDTSINTTTSVDEEQILQFILSTIEEQKAEKKVRARLIFLNSAKKILVKI